MEDEQLQRDLDGPHVSSTAFRAGRFLARNCGSGWLKIELDCPNRELEAELLPPVHAKAFHDWLITK